ncbi:MAG: farnesyl diphosphate synthase [Geminicoccaceae bacterium]
MSLLAERSTTVVAAIEQELDRLLPPSDGLLGHLGEAMRYAAMGGGKRFRPMLVAAVAELGNADPRAVARVGAAIEMVHAYSLVHDDLPAMDDALLRRGKPTCHRVFGEGIAVLAGDALLTLAFEVLGRDDWPADPALRCGLVLGLGRAAGAAGMCGGQLLDLAAEHATADVGDVLEVERLKTGAMIAFSCDAGALLASLDAATRADVAAYAADLGLAFQIKDDLLDAEGDAQATGKDSGIDAAADKATLIRLLGIDGAKAELAKVEARASGRLDNLGARATLLRELLSFVINRNA